VTAAGMLSFNPAFGSDFEPFGQTLMSFLFWHLFCSLVMERIPILLVGYEDPNLPNCFLEFSKPGRRKYKQDNLYHLNLQVNTIKLKFPKKTRNQFMILGPGCTYLARHNIVY